MHISHRARGGPTVGRLDNRASLNANSHEISASWADSLTMWFSWVRLNSVRGLVRTGIPRLAITSVVAMISSHRFRMIGSLSEVAVLLYINRI